MCLFYIFKWSFPFYFSTRNSNFVAQFLFLRIDGWINSIDERKLLTAVWARIRNYDFHVNSMSFLLVLLCFSFLFLFSYAIQFMQNYLWNSTKCIVFFEYCIRCLTITWFTLYNMCSSHHKIKLYYSMYSWLLINKMWLACKCIL